MSRKTYSSTLTCMLFALCGALAPTQASAEPPGATAPDELPPRQLDVSQSDEAEPAPSQVLKEERVLPEEDRQDEAGELPAEEPAATKASTLPSADELFEQTYDVTPTVPQEASIEEVVEDAARIVKDEPLQADEPEQDSPKTWSFIEDLKQIQELIDATKHAEAMLAAPGEPGYDLSPYLKDATWQEAMALKREGECKKALEVADAHIKTLEEQAPGVQFAIAMLYECAGKKSDSRKIVKRLAKREDIAGELAKIELGQKVKPRTAGSKKDVETATLMVKVNAAKKFARVKGQLDTGLEQLAELRASAPNSWSWYKIRVIEAELLERADRVEDAGQVWLSIYLRTRDWKSGAKIEDTIEAFEKRHKVQVLGLGERADRVRELVARGRYKEAKRANQELVKWSGASKTEIAAWSNWRKALVAERKKDRDKAIKLFEKSEKQMKRDEGRLRLYFGWARALRRVDRDNEAIALYDRMCEEFPAEALCADAMYEAGRLLQYQNKHELASAHFERLVGLFPDHRDVPDALWRAAFSLYLEGHFEQADPVLRHLRDFYGEQRDESELTLGLKAQYWLGVAALKSGDRLKAMTELQRTIDRGPLTWYGRLASERLSAMGVKPVEFEPTKKLGLDDLRNLEGVYLPKDERMARAAELIRAGLYEEAAKEVASKMKLHPAPEGAERVMASLQLAMGRPDLGHWTMKRHIEPAWPSVSTLRDWATAFPLDYMEYAHQWGVKYSVDPFLVQAIIRQESGFRPAVKSYAGAVGLMQLMPGTARYTAKVFFEDDEKKSYRRKDLLEPEKNIQLGAMYIRVHTAHAMDHIPLALAGYNAGARPLRRWVKQYGERELDAWVESITYREARGYVRKVMTSYVTYSWLYGSGELPTIGMKVPESLRTWGEVPEASEAKPDKPISLLMEAN